MAVLNGWIHRRLKDQSTAGDKRNGKFKEMNLIFHAGSWTRDLLCRSMHRPGSALPPGTDGHAGRIKSEVAEMRCFGCQLPLNLTKKEEGGEEEDKGKGRVEQPALNRGSRHIVFLLCL